MVKKSKVIEHYKKLPKNIRICIRGRSYSGKEIAEEIEKNTDIGKLIMKIERLAESAGVDDE